MTFTEVFGASVVVVVVVVFIVVVVFGSGLGFGLGFGLVFDFCEFCITFIILAMTAGPPRLSTLQAGTLSSSLSTLGGTQSRGNQQ